MEIQGSFLSILVVLLNLAACAKSDCSPNSFNRGSFPPNFLFGTASAAYQYEGATKEGGRGPSIWDTFTEKFPEKIEDHSNGTVADDSYHRYKDDVNIMKDLGFNSYRFSISWSRLLPRGKISAGLNCEGVRYYNNLINDLLSKGIQPFVTLFHWDLPQALEDEYGGFLSPKIVADFCDYVELCYKEFGDRVKHWITLNEPLSLSSMAYAEGKSAPGRCSEWMARNCLGGDSSTEPYIVGHNQLLAHAAAVKVYKDKYQASQNGQIGIVVSVPWMVPYDQSEKSYAAANRTLEFMYGWFMEPLKSGTYPAVMVEYVKQRLPKFTEEQSSMVKGSFDFIGVNYYSANYVFDVPCKTEELSYSTDPCINRTVVRNGILIGPQAAPSWLYVYPEGLHDLLLYTKEKYNNPVIYITENGIGEYDIKKSLQDSMRVDYYHSHLLALQRAIKDGVDVRGFFAWSLLDNFQWRNGYTVRFGIVQVDYINGQKRYYKDSAKWFKNFLHNGNLTATKN